MIERIDYDKCTNCDICYDICPMDCFGKIGNLVYIAYPHDCMCCYLCELHCCDDALYVSPERGRPIPLPY